MNVTFARTADHKTIEALHTLLFRHDDFPRVVPSTAMWIGTLDDGTPVAFCMARKLRWDNAVFLERAGVLNVASGKGLQRRMIRIRERWARSIGASSCLTYTSPKNYPSIINLLRSGYRFYYPASFWAGSESHYFVRDL